MPRRVVERMPVSRRAVESVALSHSRAADGDASCGCYSSPWLVSLSGSRWLEDYPHRHVSGWEEPEGVTADQQDGVCFVTHVPHL